MAQNLSPVRTAAGTIASPILANHLADDPQLLTVHGSHFLPFPNHSDVRGELTVIEQAHQVDFDIQRVYYIYNVPPGGRRGAHAHRDLHQVIIAVRGRIDAVVDDGTRRQWIRLNRPDTGLHLEPMVWSEFTYFSNDAVCLVLASGLYSDDEYVKDYEEFLSAARRLHG